MIPGWVGRLKVDGIDDEDLKLPRGIRGLRVIDKGAVTDK
jgi:hypothetical protein